MGRVIYLLWFMYCREIASRGAHGRESDVWSLGCMIYTLLVGTPPFDVSSTLKYMYMVVHLYTVYILLLD